MAVRWLVVAPGERARSRRAFPSSHAVVVVVARAARPLARLGGGCVCVWGCCVSQAQGKLDEAAPLALRAHGIFDKALGPQHPDTLNSRGNLGRVAMLRGDGRSAEGRAAVEAALRALKAPPHSLPDAHRWIRKFEGFLA